MLTNTSVSSASTDIHFDLSFATISICWMMSTGTVSFLSPDDHSAVTNIYWDCVYFLTATQSWMISTGTVFPISWWPLRHDWCPLGLCLSYLLMTTPPWLMSTGTVSFLSPDDHSTMTDVHWDCVFPISWWPLRHDWCPLGLCLSYLLMTTPPWLMSTGTVSFLSLMTTPPWLMSTGTLSFLSPDDHSAMTDVHWDSVFPISWWPLRHDWCPLGLCLSYLLMTTPPWLMSTGTVSFLSPDDHSAMTDVHWDCVFPISWCPLHHDWCPLGLCLSYLLMTTPPWLMSTGTVSFLSPDDHSAMTDVHWDCVFPISWCPLHHDWCPLGLCLSYLLMTTPPWLMSTGTVSFLSPDDHSAMTDGHWDCVFPISWWPLRHDWWPLGLCLSYLLMTTPSWLMSTGTMSFLSPDDHSAMTDVHWDCVFPISWCPLHHDWCPLGLCLSYLLMTTPPWLMSTGTVSFLSPDVHSTMTDVHWDCVFPISWRPLRHDWCPLGLCLSYLLMSTPPWLMSTGTMSFLSPDDHSAMTDVHWDCVFPISWWPLHHDWCPLGLCLSYLLMTTPPWLMSTGTVSFLSPDVHSTMTDVHWDCVFPISWRPLRHDWCPLGLCLSYLLMSTPPWLMSTGTMSFLSPDDHSAVTDVHWDCVFPISWWPLRHDWCPLGLCLSYLLMTTPPWLMSTGTVSFLSPDDHSAVTDVHWDCVFPISWWPLRHDWCPLGLCLSYLLMTTPPWLMSTGTLSFLSPDDHSAVTDVHWDSVFPISWWPLRHDWCLLGLCLSYLLMTTPPWLMSTGTVSFLSPDDHSAMTDVHWDCVFPISWWPLRHDWCPLGLCLSYLLTTTPPWLMSTGTVSFLSPDDHSAMTDVHWDSVFPIFWWPLHHDWCPLGLCLSYLLMTTLPWLMSTGTVSFLSPDDHSAVTDVHWDCVFPISWWPLRRDWCPLGLCLSYLLMTTPPWLMSTGTVFPISWWPLRHDWCPLGLCLSYLLMTTPPWLMSTGTVSFLSPDDHSAVTGVHWDCVFPISWWPLRHDWCPLGLCLSYLLMTTPPWLMSTGTVSFLSPDDHSAMTDVHWDYVFPISWWPLRHDWCPLGLCLSYLLMTTPPWLMSTGTVSFLSPDDHSAVTDVHWDCVFPISWWPLRRDWCPLGLCLSYLLMTTPPWLMSTGTVSFLSPDDHSAMTDVHWDSVFPIFWWPLCHDWCPLGLCLSYLLMTTPPWLMSTGTVSFLSPDDHSAVTDVHWDCVFPISWWPLRRDWCPLGLCLSYLLMTTPPWLMSTGTVSFLSPDDHSAMTDVHWDCVFPISWWPLRRDWCPLGLCLSYLLMTTPPWLMSTGTVSFLSPDDHSAVTDVHWDCVFPISWWPLRHDWCPLGLCLSYLLMTTPPWLMSTGTVSFLSPDDHSAMTDVHWDCVFPISWWPLRRDWCPLGLCLSYLLMTTPPWLVSTGTVSFLSPDDHSAVTDVHWDCVFPISWWPLRRDWCPLGLCLSYLLMTTPPWLMSTGTVSFLSPDDHSAMTDVHWDCVFPISWWPLRHDWCLLGLCLSYLLMTTPPWLMSTGTVSFLSPDDHSAMTDVYWDCVFPISWCPLGPCRCL